MTDIFFHTIVYSQTTTTRLNFNSVKEFSAQHYQIFFFGTPLKPTKLVCPLVNIIQCFFFLHFLALNTFFGVYSQLVGSCVILLGNTYWVGSSYLQNEKKTWKKIASCCILFDSNAPLREV